MLLMLFEIPLPLLADCGGQETMLLAHQYLN